MEAIREANELDEEMREWHEKYKRSELSYEYSLKEGVMLFQGRLLVPGCSKLRNEILQLYHVAPSAGHGGFQKIYRAIAKIFYWKQMRKDVMTFIKNCETW